MITLERFCDHNRETQGAAPMGCLGEILIDGQYYCYTIEPPWRQNRRFVSCVPVGHYRLEEFRSAKYGHTVALVNADIGVVAHERDAQDSITRYACLFHAANWSHELHGCIAPGDGIDWGQDPKDVNINPNLMVTNSGNTLRTLLPLLREHGELLIRWKHER